jgi:hypothetical protein
MSQVTPVAATTDVRRSGRALRPWLLLGGFVVLWWCLATGTAHAEDGSHDLRKATQALTGTVERATHRPVQHVAEHAGPVAETATPAVRTVEKKVENTVARTVAQTVAQTPVAPVLEAATSPVRTAIAPVLEQTREALGGTILGTVTIPELQGPAGLVGALPVVGTPDLSGVTAPAPAPIEPPVVQAAVADTSPATGLTAPSTFALQHQDRVVPVGPAGAPWGGPAFGALGGTAVAAAQSGSGTSGPSAALQQALPAIGPDTTSTLVPSHSDRRPVGQAYQPSSSPD